MTWLCHVSLCLLERPCGFSPSKNTILPKTLCDLVSVESSVITTYEIVEAKFSWCALDHLKEQFPVAENMALLESSWHLFAVTGVFSNVLFSICAHRRSSAALPVWISTLHFAASSEGPSSRRLWRGAAWSQCFALLCFISWHVLDSVRRLEIVLHQLPTTFEALGASIQVDAICFRED